MAKKAPAAVGVDFIVRTMMERESSGKRKIRPKNVEDVLLPEDSDDSDYDYVGDNDDVDEDDSGEDGSDDSAGSSEDESDDSDSDDDGSSGSEDSGDESDDEASNVQTSALRETMKKLNDAPDFPKPKKKRKKPPKKSKDGTTMNKISSNIGSSEEPTEATLNGPVSSKKRKKAKSKVNKNGNKSSTNGDDGSTRGKRKKKSRGGESSKKKEKRKSKYNSVSSLVDKMDSLQSEGRREINLDHRICWFCLGDKSDETNEIIECDSCGITVHEVCYGVNDDVSVSSGTDSSNSTEPWFCDACKSGARTITCELCPAKGGLFKETTTGRWVHLICAMYTPGIRVSDDGTPNLLDISYSNWGYYLCSACENEKDARIGITIRCDAGLCKTYLHATCAHKAGLLSDPNGVDLSGQVADPYFAACKMHTNRTVARRRADSYKTLQEQIRVRQERKKADNLTESERREQSRIESKIEKIRSKMAMKIFQKHMDPTSYPSKLPELPSTEISLPWKEGTKKPRMLHTTPYKDKFLSKAALIGHDVKTLELEEKHERIASNVKRKWNVLPSLSVEYAAYFIDRELRLTNLSDQCEKLEKDKLDLIDKHAGMKSAYEAMTFAHKMDVEEGEKVARTIESLREILTLLSPTNKHINSIVVPKRRHSSTNSRRSPPAKRDRRSPSGKRNKSKSKSSPINGSQSPTGRLRIVKCAVCNNSDDQHLITRCDKCRKNYHLRCLDPPLSRMPKKSKSFGWMCSDCGDDSEDSDHPHVDTEAPRSLRGRENLKKPNKYRGGSSPAASNHIGEQQPQPRTPKTPKSGSTPKTEKESMSVWGTPAANKKPEPNSSSPVENSANNFTEGKCVTCNRDDYKKNLVQCDKCYLEFHFLCLQPPLKYSPKRRGYSWFCADCDEASDGEGEAGMKVDSDNLEDTKA